MAQKIEIIEKEIGHVIEIEENVSVFKLPSIMGKDLKLISEYLEEKSVKSKDAPYARYLDIDWDVQTQKGMLANLIDLFTKKWHFLNGFTIPTELEAKDNMKTDLIKLKKYVQTTHFGPYQKVGNTYKNMYVWAKEQNFELVGESIEFYLNDPRETKKELLETLVLIPIK